MSFLLVVMGKNVLAASNYRNCSSFYFVCLWGFLVFFATTNQNTAMPNSAEYCKLQWAIERPWSEWRTKKKKKKWRTICRGSCQFLQWTIFRMIKKAWVPLGKDLKKLNRYEKKADKRPLIYFAVGISFCVHSTGFSKECMVAMLDAGVWVLCRSRLKDHWCGSTQSKLKAKS